MGSRSSSGNSGRQAKQTVEENCPVHTVGDDQTWDVTRAATDISVTGSRFSHGNICMWCLPQDWSSSQCKSVEVLEWFGCGIRPHSFQSSFMPLFWHSAPFISISSGSQKDRIYPIQIEPIKPKESVETLLYFKGSSEMEDITVSQDITEP